MTRGQQITEALRKCGVEMAPDRAEDVTDLIAAIARLAGTRVTVLIHDAVISTDRDSEEMAFVNLEG